KLFPRKSGGVDPHPALAALDESLQCLLLRVSHIKRGEMQHDKHLILLQVLLVDCLRIIGEVHGEVVLICHPGKEWFCARAHLQMIFGSGGNDERFERTLYVHLATPIPGSERTVLRRKFKRPGLPVLPTSPSPAPAA